MIKVTACSEKGRRTENQDNFLIDKITKGDQTDSFSYVGTLDQTDQKVFLVCDGMGGEAYGQEASRMAVEYLEAVLKNRQKPLEAIELARQLRRLNQKISRFYELHMAKGGTTFSALLLSPDGIADVINLGDSPIFKIGKEGISLLSEMQSLAGLKLKNGMITKEDYEKGNEKNILVAYLGDSSGISIDKIFYTRVKYEKGDRFLLMSDGLLEVMQPETIEQKVQEGSTAEDLVKEGLERQAADNITVVSLEV